MLFVMRDVSECGAFIMFLTLDSVQAYAGGDAERIMGEVIADGIADGFWRRQDLVITTKVLHTHLPMLI